MSNTEEVARIYEKIKDHISLEEFKDKINAKMAMMNNLCDAKTAAMFVVYDLGINLNDRIKIADITPESGSVTFEGKIISITDIKEFARNDGSTGYVGNITLGDETGTIRVALWDEASDLIKIGDLKPGQSVVITGFAKDGYSGTEISVGKRDNIDHISKDIKVRIKTRKINSIKSGNNDINVLGRVLDTGEKREFQRKDGKKGIVRNILIGDETGKMRVVLWDARAENIDFKPGDAVEIINGYARENSFSSQVELQVGAGGSIKRSDSNVGYSEEITPVKDIDLNGTYSVRGHVTGLEEPREFERGDGTKDRVANIYLSDDTGRIRVVLWGKHAGMVEDIDIGSVLQITDCYAKPGRNEEVELSVGSRSMVQVIKK